MGRAREISVVIGEVTGRHPRLTAIMLSGLAILAVAAAALAAAALLAGPIGVDLLKSFTHLPMSRLSVLQLGAGGVLILTAPAIILVLNWPNAPSWLRRVCGGPLWRRWVMWIGSELSPRHETRLFWGLAMPATVLAAISMLNVAPPLACLEPDTIGYLTPSAIRSAGYMVFLKIVVALSGDLRWLGPIQLGLMLASFLFLGWSTWQAVRSPVAGALVAILPTLSPPLLILAPAAMTEALFVALICLHLGLALRLLKRVIITDAVMCGLTLGIMIVVRPNGLSFLIGLPALLLMLRGRRVKPALGLAIPVALVVLAQCAYNQQSFGFFGLHKFGGISLAGNVAPLIRAEMKGTHPGLAATLDERLGRYYVDFPRGMQNFPFQMAEAASLTTVGAIYFEILPAIRLHLGLPEPKAVALEYDPRISEIAGTLALDAIRHDPLGFATIAAANYAANWRDTLPVRVPMAIYFPRCRMIAASVAEEHPGIVGRFTDAALYSNAAVAQSYHKVASGGVRAIELPRMAMISLVQPWLAGAAFITSLIALAALVTRPVRLCPIWQAMALAGLSVQAGYGLISLGNASFTRYTVVFDPVVFLLLVVAGTGLLRFLFSQHSVEAGADRRESVGGGNALA